MHLYNAAVPKPIDFYVPSAMMWIVVQAPPIGFKIGVFHLHLSLNPPPPPPCSTVQS